MRRKLNGAPGNAECVAPLRKHTKRIVGIDNVTIGVQQRNAIGKPLQRIFQHTAAITGCSQAGCDVMRTLIVRAKPLHEGDFTLANMALLASPLDADGRCLL